MFKKIEAIINAHIIILAVRSLFFLKVYTHIETQSIALLIRAEKEVEYLKQSFHASYHLRKIQK